jgi:hypothetical protein
MDSTFSTKLVPYHWRPLHIIPQIPDDVLDIIESYTEIECTHRLTQELSRGNFPIATLVTIENIYTGSRFKRYIHISNFEDLLGDRFKILKAAQIEIKKIQDIFSDIFIIFKNDIPESMSWLLTPQQNLVEVGEGLNTPALESQRITAFIDECRNIELPIIRSIAQYLLEILPISRNQLLEKALIKHPQSDYLKMIKELFKLVDFFNDKSRSECLFSTIKDLVNCNINYLVLIPEILHLNNINIWDINQIIFFLIYCDFNRPTRIQKGELVAFLLSLEHNLVKKKFGTLTDISNASKISIDKLTKSISLSVEYNAEPLANYFARNCFFDSLSSQEPNRINELKYLYQTNKVSSFAICQLLFWQPEWTPFIPVLKVIGFTIRITEIIQALPNSISNLSQRDFSSRFLAFIIFLIKDYKIKVTGKEQVEIEDMLKLITATPPLKGFIKRKLDSIKAKQDPNALLKKDAELQQLIQAFHHLIKENQKHPS